MTSLAARRAEGPSLLSSCAFGQVKLWDPARPVYSTRSFAAHAGAATAVAWLGEHCFVSGGSDGWVRTWDTRAAPAAGTGDGCVASSRVGGAVTALCGVGGGAIAAVDDGRVLAVGDQDGGRSAQLLWTQPGGAHSIDAAVAAGGGSTTVVTGGDDCAVRSAAVTAEGEVGEVAEGRAAHKDYVRGVVVCREGVASASWDGTVTLWPAER